MQQTKAGSLGKATGGNRVLLWLLLAPAVLFLFIFLVVPMFGLFRASFYEGNQPLGGVGFSLQHYEKFLSDGYYLGILAETVGFGLASAFVSLLIGFPVGYSLADCSPAGSRLRFPNRAAVCGKLVLPVEAFSSNGVLFLNCLSHARGRFRSFLAP